MNYIIVTNTINRSSELVSTSLRASLNQKVEPVKVILLDQNKAELALPEEISKNPKFERQIVRKNSVSATRNSLKIPDEIKWIFFCDDDGYPADDYSEILSELIKTHPNVEIFAGSIIRNDNFNFYSLRQSRPGSLKYFRNTKKLMGSNFVVKVSTFESLNKFDENFGAGAYFGSGEETDFAWKAFFNKIHMEYFPELKVYHVPPFNESIKTGFKKSLSYGIGKGALVFKWIFVKKKFKAFYEFAEMFIIPLIQFVRGIFTIKLALITNNIASLIGRIWGIFKAAKFYMRKN